jgi:hypothetical protein
MRERQGYGRNDLHSPKMRQLLPLSPNAYIVHIVPGIPKRQRCRERQRFESIAAHEEGCWSGTGSILFTPHVAGKAAYNRDAQMLNTTIDECCNPAVGVQHLTTSTHSNEIQGPKGKCETDHQDTIWILGWRPSGGRSLGLGCASHGRFSTAETGDRDKYNVNESNKLGLQQNLNPHWVHNRVDWAS